MKINLRGGKVQKKLVSFRNLDLVNTFIKAEADATDRTEASVIENIILKEYLSEDDRIAELIANNITDDNAIVKCSSLIFELFADTPGAANDSLLDLIGLLTKLVDRYAPKINNKSDGFKEMSAFAKEYSTFIEEEIRKNPTLMYYDASVGHMTHVGIDYLHMLNVMSNIMDNKDNMDSENITFLIFHIVKRMWDFGGDFDTPTLKNWTVTYKLLESVINMVTIPDYAFHVYDFLTVTKRIVMDNKHGNFDAGNHLTKQVFLKEKSFVTTETAEILKINPDYAETQFRNALRVIKGPGKGITEKPYVVLYNDENDTEIDTFIKNAVRNYPDDFPDPDEVFAVQFLYNGDYCDQRVRWKTV